MKKYNMRFMISILIFYFILLTNPVYADLFSKASQGFIDISKMEIDSEQKVPIQGEAEFYWEQLLEPEDFLDNQLEPSYVHFPSSWRGQSINGEPLGNFGYATYRLQLNINPNDIGQEKVLFFDYVGSAYKVWVDGQRKSGVGIVGKTASQEEPRLQINYIHFEPTKETVEIVVQTSNFSYREGGILREVFFGTPSSIYLLALKNQLPSFLLIGGLFLFGVYSLIIYTTFRTQWDSLMVGIGAIAIAIRYSITNKYLSFLELPFVPWELLKKVEYLVELVALLMLILIMRFMYRKEVHSLLIKLSYVYISFSFLFFIVTPPRIFTQVVTVHLVIIAILLGYFIFYVGFVALKRKRIGAKINAIGLVILLVSIVNELLYSLQVVPTVSVVNYSAAIFILLQGVIISNRNFTLSKRNKLLNAELTEMNDQLEETVVRRTQQLEEKNSELEKVNVKLEVLSSEDALTGLPNRRQLDFVLETEFGLAREKDQPLAIAFLDVDYFKDYNDTYGHFRGDDCLKQLAIVIKSHMRRKSDVVARFGGEEFIIVLPNTVAEEATQIAEEIRKAVEALKESHMNSPFGVVTISIGISVGGVSTDDQKQDLLKKADEALYKAKANGRNQVVVGGRNPKI